MISAGSSPRITQARPSTSSSPAKVRGPVRRQAPGQIGGRPGQQAGQVVGMAPGGRLLGPRRAGRLLGEGRQDTVGVRPAHVVQHLERLVGEVDGVAAVEEDVVGGGRPHDGGQPVRRRGRSHRAGQDCARPRRRSRVSMKRRYQAAQPLGREGRRQRLQGEPRGMAPGVPGHEGQPVHEGQHPVLLVEPVEHVDHAGQHREPRPPPGAPVAGSEVDPGPRRLRGAAWPGPGRRVRPSTALAITSVSPCSRPSSRRRRNWVRRSTAGSTTTTTSLPSSLDRVGPHVVGEGIEGAARLEVEAGVVPVAGQQAVLRPCPGAAESPYAGSGRPPRRPGRRTRRRRPAAPPTLAVSWPLAISSSQLPTRTRSLLFMATPRDPLCPRRLRPDA